MERTSWKTLVGVFTVKLTELTMESLRLCLMTHGWAVVSSALSFVDVGLSLLALGFVVRHLTSRSVMIAYCAGYAAGNYLGTSLFNILA
jgi:uncharacterized protein YebE (UPF0316 family)